jgi:hypothetical protein
MHRSHPQRHQVRVRWSHQHPSRHMNLSQRHWCRHVQRIGRVPAGGRLGVSPSWVQASLSLNAPRRAPLATLRASVTKSKTPLSVLWPPLKNGAALLPSGLASSWPEAGLGSTPTVAVHTLTGDRTNLRAMARPVPWWIQSALDNQLRVGMMECVGYTGQVACARPCPFMLHPHLHQRGTQAQHQRRLHRQYRPLCPARLR